MFLAIHVWFHYGNPRKPIPIESACLMMKILVPFPYNAFISVSFDIRLAISHSQNDVSKVSAFFVCVLRKARRERAKIERERGHLDEGRIFLLKVFFSSGCKTLFHTCAWVTFLREAQKSLCPRKEA